MKNVVFLYVNHNDSFPQLSSFPFASNTGGHELNLMQKFKEQLQVRTQVLEADITSQQDALEMMKEQLQTMQRSAYQVRDWLCISGRRESGEGP